MRVNKSTLLKIMAGVETEYFGETWKPDDLRIGYLPQEPQLDESTDVRGNVELAVASTRDLKTRGASLLRFSPVNAPLRF